MAAQASVCVAVGTEQGLSNTRRRKALDEPTHAHDIRRTLHPDIRDPGHAGDRVLRTVEARVDRCVAMITRKSPWLAAATGP